MVQIFHLTSFSPHYKYSFKHIVMFYVYKLVYILCQSQQLIKKDVK